MVFTLEKSRGIRSTRRRRRRKRRRWWWSLLLKIEGDPLHATRATPATSSHGPMECSWSCPWPPACRARPVSCVRLLFLPCNVCCVCRRCMQSFPYLVSLCWPGGAYASVCLGGYMATPCFPVSGDVGDLECQAIPIGHWPYPPGPWSWSLGLCMRVSAVNT